MCTRIALQLLWYVDMVTKELRQSGEAQSAALSQPVEKRDLMLPAILCFTSHFIHYNEWMEGRREGGRKGRRKEGKNQKEGRKEKEGRQRRSQDLRKEKNNPGAIESRQPSFFSIFFYKNQCVTRGYKVLKRHSELANSFQVRYSFCPSHPFSHTESELVQLSMTKFVNL